MSPSPNANQAHRVCHTFGCVLPSASSSPVLANISPSPNPNDESPKGLVEPADWRRQVDEVQKILTSESAALLASLGPGDLQSVKDAIEMGLTIYGKLQDLEKLQQSRLDDIHRYHDEWHRAGSDRTRRLGDLDRQLSEQQNELSRSRQITKQQDDDANKIARELSALTSQRVDALEKFNTIKESSKKREEFVRQEDIRLDQKSAALDAREQDLRSQGNELNRELEALNQSHRDLADKQEEESKRAEENKNRTTKIYRRLDYLVQSQAQWEQRIAALTSQVEELKVDNGGLREAKSQLEARVANVAQLEENIQSQNKELSEVRTNEAEKAKLKASLIHLTSVTLPQKDTELNGFKAEIAKMKASENRLKNRISDVDAERTTLQDQRREQIIQINELEENLASLRVAADETARKAESADKRLAVAKATVGTLQLELDDVRNQNHGLKSEVQEMRPCKIDFEAAKRLQDASNAKIHELERERDKISLDHDKVHQQLQALALRHDQLSKEVRKHLDFHKEVIEENNTVKAERDRLGGDIERLRLQRGKALEQVETAQNRADAWRVECDNLRTVNADTQKEKLALSERLEIAEEKVESLKQQLQSCHCSDERSSRKRRHDQVDSDEDESSADESGRLARRSGKAPESRANLTATRHSATGGRSESSGQPPSGPTTRSSAPVMNTTAPRALGTAKSTITPSNGVAFTFSLTDAKLQNFSSDVLPVDVIQALQRKFRVWSANKAFNWAADQSSTGSRSCIEVRANKQKSDWNNGSGYACAMCEKRMRLCIVVDSAARVLLLPRKAAENQSRVPADSDYWMR